MTNERAKLTETDIEDAIALTLAKLKWRRNQKGMGTMASSHEILGLLDEELYEYRKTVHEKLPQEDRVQELMDIANAAIFGIASIRSGGVDW